MKFLISEKQFKFIVENIKNTALELLNEGVNEENALKILKDSGVENSEEIVNYIKTIDKSQNKKYLPFIATFYVRNPGLSDVSKIVNTFKKIFDSKKQIPDIKRVDENTFSFLGEIFSFRDIDEFEDYINHKYYEYSKEEEELEKKLISVEENIIFENNKFILYYAASPQVCIKIFGKDYKERQYVERPFCIGWGRPEAPASYYSDYRSESGSKKYTFYVIVDKEKLKNFVETGTDDPSIINVIAVKVSDSGNLEYFIWDKHNKPNGDYVEGFNDVPEYIEYLKNNGINFNAIVPKPYIETTDRAIDRLLQSPRNLSFFLDLTPAQKVKYVKYKASFLTFEQMKYVIKQLPEDVLDSFLKGYTRLLSLERDTLNLLPLNKQKTYVNSKLIQLFNNNSNFDDESFIEAVINPQLIEFTKNKILDSLSKGQDDPNQNVNREETFKLLSYFEPVKFFEAKQEELLSENGSKTLTLDRSNFKSTFLPENIGDFIYKIERLKFENLNIESIPASIGKCKNLTMMTIADCTQLKSLPEEIGQLTNLNKLLITNTSIRETPKEIGNLQNLQLLTIGDSLLTEVPNIKNLKNLKMLKLPDNRIREVNWDIFFNEGMDIGTPENPNYEAFSHPELTMVNLHDNPLTINSEDEVKIQVLRQSCEVYYD